MAQWLGLAWPWHGTGNQSWRRRLLHTSFFGTDTTIGTGNPCNLTPCWVQLTSNTCQLLASLPILSSDDCQRQQPFVRQKLSKSKVLHLQGWVRQCGTQREVGEGVGVRFASKWTNEANSIFSNRQSELLRLPNSAKAQLCYLAKKILFPM